MAAEQAPRDPLIRDGDRVAIRDEDGSVSWVAESDLEAARAEGARPATETEWANAKMGTAGTYASAAIGLGQGATANFAVPGLIAGAEALGAEETADDIRRAVRIARETHPDAYLAGELSGAALPLVTGAGAAATTAKEVTGGGLARAATRFVRAAPEAAGIGAGYEVGAQATEDAIEDKGFAASSYLTAAAKGGVLGLLLGGGLHAGFGAVGDAYGSRLGRRALTEEAALAEEAAPAITREPGRVSIDPDAGLFGGPGPIEKPFTFGPRRYGVTTDTAALENEFASIPGGNIRPVEGTRSVSLDPAAFETGLVDAAESPIGRRAFLGKEPAPGSPEARDWWLQGGGLPANPEEPIDILRIGRMPRVREGDFLDFGEATAPVFPVKTPPVSKGTPVASERVPLEMRWGIDADAGLREASGVEQAGLRISEGPTSFRLGINPNAGLEEEEIMGRRVFGTTRAKNAPREVRLGDVAPEGVIPTAERGPLRIGAPTEAAVEEIAAAEGQRGAQAWLEAQANKQAFNATGAKVGDIRRLADTVEGQQAMMERLGGRLRSETIEGKPLIEPTISQAEIAKRVTDRANEIGKELGVLRSELDKAAVRPDMNAIVARFESEVAAPLEAMPLGEADLYAAKKYLGEMVEKGGERPSFDTLYKFRRRLDDKLKKEYAAFPGAPPQPGADAMRALRGIIEDEFTKAGELAASEIGTEFASKYKLTKELYADLATLRRIATSEAERNAGANAVSITDVIAASTGGLPGLAAFAGNQIRRKYGNQLLSHVLGKASNLFAVEHAAFKMDQALNKGAKAFVAGEKAAAREARKVTADEVRQIREAVQSPQAVTAKIETALGDLPKHAPKLAAQVSTRAATVAAFLRDNLPKEPPPPTMGFGKPKPRPISDSELLRAQHIIETAEDPSVVIDRLIQGRLTDAHVETLKIAHPDVYKKVETYLRQHGQELAAELPMQRLAAISLLFGQPVHEAFLPENIRALQGTFVSGSQAPKQDMSAGGAGLPVRLDKLGESSATAGDRLERGE